MKKRNQRHQMSLTSLEFTWQQTLFLIHVEIPFPTVWRAIKPPFCLYWLEMCIWKSEDDENLSLKIAWKLLYERHYSYDLFTKPEKTTEKNGHWWTWPTNREHYRWRSLKEKVMPSNFISMSHMIVLKSNCLDSLAISKLLALNIHGISWVK